MQGALVLAPLLLDHLGVGAGYQVQEVLLVVHRLVEQSHGPGGVALLWHTEVASPPVRPQHGFWQHVPADEPPQGLTVPPLDLEQAALPGAHPHEADHPRTPYSSSVDAVSGQVATLVRLPAPLVQGLVHLYHLTGATHLWSQLELLGCHLSSEASPMHHRLQSEPLK